MQAPYQMTNIIHNITKEWIIIYRRRNSMSNITVVTLNDQPIKSSIHNKFRSEERRVGKECVP